MLPGSVQWTFDMDTPCFSEPCLMQEPGGRPRQQAIFGIHNLLLSVDSGTGNVIWVKHLGEASGAISTSATVMVSWEDICRGLEGSAGLHASSKGGIENEQGRSESEKVLPRIDYGLRRRNTEIAEPMFICCSNSGCLSWLQKDKCGSGKMDARGEWDKGQVIMEFDCFSSPVAFNGYVVMGSRGDYLCCLNLIGWDLRRAVQQYMEPYS